MTFFSLLIPQESETEKNSVAKFVQVWNQIIASFRLEDLINNRLILFNFVKMIFYDL